MIVKTAGIHDLVAPQIEQVETKMRQFYGDPNPVLTEAIDYLVSAGGKRLRSVITLLVCRFGQPEPDKVISLAAAVEMLHTATLVHDDLIDNSLFRRGSPTLNAKWTPAATVLTGDYMFARSSAFAAETQIVRVVEIFAHSLMVIVNGELLQFFNNGHNRPPTRQEYDQRIYAKTAALFITAAETGAVLADLPESQVKALHDYGYYLGMAFQIMDDILDFQGDQDRIGKPVAHDLRQGIITLPVLNFLEDYPNHPTILKAANRQKLTDDEVATVVQAIRDSGSITEAHREAERFARQAREVLAILPPSEHRQALENIADYAVVRDI